MEKIENITCVEIHWRRCYYVPYITVKGKCGAGAQITQEPCLFHFKLQTSRAI